MSYFVVTVQMRMGRQKQQTEATIQADSPKVDYERPQKHYLD